MNAAHVHLLLNHVAILGAIFSFVILAWSLIRKNNSIRIVALVGFIVSALFAIPVFLTGEETEEIVENISGISKSMIESHEESATIAFWLIEFAGAISLIILLGERYHWKFATRLNRLLLLLALVTAGTIGYTGYIGGKIHHTEISTNTATHQSGSMQGAQESDDD